MKSIEQARDELLSTGISPEALAGIVNDVRPAIHHPGFLPTLRSEIIGYGIDDDKADRLVQAIYTLAGASG